MQFGYVDTNTGTAFKGYIDSHGKMEYKSVDRKMTVKNWVELPRWARFGDFLQKSCFGRNVNLTFTVNRGWILETTFFSISGKEKDVMPLYNSIVKCLEEY